MSRETGTRLRVKADWQTQYRYDFYVACTDDGHGLDITTGKPIKTFEEWSTS